MPGHIYILWRSVLPQSCHSLATVLPQSCHSLATVLPQSCHSLATVLPQSCHSLATVLPQSCHSLATVLPQSCHSLATVLPQSCHSLATVLPQSCQHLHLLLHFFRATFCGLVLQLDHSAAAALQQAMTSLQNWSACLSSSVQQLYMQLLQSKVIQRHAIRFDSGNCLRAAYSPVCLASRWTVSF